MSRTVSSDRQTLVPSFPLLPLERLAYSIATKRSLSREFFNKIDPKPPLGLLQSRQRITLIGGRNGGCKRWSDTWKPGEHFDLGAHSTSAAAHLPLSGYRAVNF